MDKKKGWYFNVGQKEYFVETNQQNKTKKFAEKILQEIKAEISEGNIQYILYSLMKANLEIKHCKNFPDYYNIFGENFSGYGSNVDDGKTIILKIV
mgnify:CR=1 FL=1